MLTDIFSRRYEAVPIWEFFNEESRRLIVQGFQLLKDIYPFYNYAGKESDEGKAAWTQLHSLLARELGLTELSPIHWGYYNNQNYWLSGTYTMLQVCETWMLKPYDGTVSADRFIKERLSLVEIGFRRREQEVANANARLPQELVEAAKTNPRRGGIVLPGSRVDGLKAMNASINLAFSSAVSELNARFRQAGCNLNYHNGFIQISADGQVAETVETPFWALVADPKWKNVDHEMKEAIDERDGGGRDAALCAARALESTIKIISQDKKLSTGNERGAANYIDNLKRGKLIEDWEGSFLREFFSKVRNPFGHGAGADSMPQLNEHQTNWAIENSMIWIKSLVRRV